VIAPHVDLHRGAPTYSWAYSALVEAQPVTWAAELDAPRTGSARLTARGDAVPGRYAVIVDVAGRRARLHLELHVPAHGAPWAVAPGAAAVPVARARSLPAGLRKRVRNRLRRTAPAPRAVAG
jgi:hypothetical protein